MKITTFTLLAAVALSTAACHPYHPHHGDFCPPGQAKKGNC